MAEVNTERVQKTYDYIRIFPGIKQYTLRIMLGIDNWAVQSALMACEQSGHLLYEDDNGGLYVYKDQP